jgi:hypothetical protein
MKTVTRDQVGHAELALPPRVQEALGGLVSSAKEGLLALSVGVGLGVLAELMEEEVEEVVGAKGKHNSERAAVRHGHEAREVTLGGRRVGVERPRVRSVDGEREVPLRTYQHFADRDPFSRHVLEQMLAGVSTRRFQRTREPVGAEVEAVARATSRSAVSREFVGRTREHLLGLMSRRLDDVRLAVLMLDGIELKGRCCVVCARHHNRRGEDPARALGRLDRERHRRQGAAVEPRRPRTRPGPGCALRDRRRQGAQEGDRRSARPGARPALYPAQGAKRARPPSRARQAGRAAEAAAGVGS